MPYFLTANTLLQCAFGAAPCSLMVPPLPGRPDVNGMAIAAITDTAPTNIPSFGMCSSMANPQVAAATAAAQGVLTPMPCTPVLTPWSPASVTTTVGGLPAALANSRCQCSFGGSVGVAMDPNFIAEG